MNTAKRSRARVLTPEGLKKLRERMRSHEAEHNAGTKYTLEKLGELTGLDPETVKNVLDGKGSDKRTIARCFDSFGLTLADSDHIPAAQATATTTDPNFVGRDGAIADLNTLVSRNARVIVIQARGGVGKTTLARKYLQQEFGSFLEFPIAKETKDIASIEGLIEEKLRQLGEEPGREFLVSLDRLKRKLQAERIGILIDNLEPALDSAGKFIEAHRRYVELLRVLSDPTVQSITLITSRERLREADVTVQHYPLRSLDVPAWEQFFQSRSIEIETPEIAALHNAYGGNAKAMDIISGAVLEDFAGNVEAYWQANQDDLFIERDLEDLVTKQFERLQQLDSDAYNLLCRMGCYRYQDVPTVSIEGLFCLLWDVPENRHRRVIRSLQDRSLIDFEDGEFWLHPVIRAEAVSRLRPHEDWQVSNNKAAEFWTESVKSIKAVKDALCAFQAFHHHLEIQQFDKAGEVIMKRRPSNWYDSKEGESLNAAFNRLGMLMQVISSLNQVINHVTSESSLCRLYFYLGSVYRLIGCFSESINYSEKSIGIASKQANNSLILTEVDALTNIGNCKIDLWELEEASKYFEMAMQKKDVDEYFKDTCYFRLAFLNSYLGLRDKAFYFADKSYSQISEIKLSAWGIGYRFLSLGTTYKNLGNSDRAYDMYRKAIYFAEESRYVQVKAVALYGLSGLLRDQNNFNMALSSHLESIEILNEIGAKHDLAEAYYQFGLTYRAMGDFDSSNSKFQGAIRLFSEMEAPKQVERVRQSMQN